MKLGLSELGFTTEYRIQLKKYIKPAYNVHKSGFVKRPAFSSQSELFKSFLNCFDWLDKTRPSKKATSFMDM